MKWIVLLKVDSQSQEPVIYEDIVEADDITFLGDGEYVVFNQGNDNCVAIYPRGSFVRAIRANDEP